MAGAGFLARAAGLLLGGRWDHSAAGGLAGWGGSLLGLGCVGFAGLSALSEICSER